MHGAKNLNSILRQKTNKPRRIPTSNLVVGSWRLEESPDGHLQITNMETGVSTILAWNDIGEEKDGSD